MIKPLISSLLLAAAALSHCADSKKPGLSVAESACTPSAAPFARQLVSPTNGGTGVSPALGTIEIKMVNIPPGAMTLVRTMAPVTLSSGSGKTVQSATLQFSGGATYTGSIPVLQAHTVYRVTAPDPTDLTRVEIIGCFAT